MFSKTQSGPLKHWIVNSIIVFDPHDNVKNVFNKAKTVKLIQDLTQNIETAKERVKEVTDGNVFIDAVFTEKCLNAFKKEFDDELVPQWNQALIILKDFCLDYHYDETLENSKFILRVHRFDLWDLQQSFYTKNSPTWCMYDRTVKKKSLETWKIIRTMLAQPSSQSSFEEYHSISELIDEMGENEKDAEAMETDSEQSSNINQNSPASPLTQLREYNTGNFIIPKEDAKILDSLKEWKDDYIPSCSTGSSEQSNSTDSHTLQEKQDEFQSTLKNERKGESEKGKKNQKMVAPEDLDGEESDLNEISMKSCEISAEEMDTQQQDKNNSLICDSTTDNIIGQKPHSSVNKADKNTNNRETRQVSSDSQAFFPSTCPFSPLLNSDDQNSCSPDVFDHELSSREIQIATDQREEQRLYELSSPQGPENDSCVSPMKRLRLEHSAQNVQKQDKQTDSTKDENSSSNCADERLNLERSQGESPESVLSGSCEAKVTQRKNKGRRKPLSPTSELGSVCLEKLMCDFDSQSPQNVGTFDHISGTSGKTVSPDDVQIIDSSLESLAVVPESETQKLPNCLKNFKIRTVQVEEENSSQSDIHKKTIESIIPLTPLDRSSVFKTPHSVSQTKTELQPPKLEQMVLGKYSDRNIEGVKDSLLTPRFLKDTAPQSPLLCSGSVISTPENSLPCYQTSEPISSHNEVESQPTQSDVESLLNIPPSEAEARNGFKFPPVLLQRIHRVLNKNKWN